MQRVGVLGGHLQEVVVAGVDAHAVVDVLGEPRLRLAVALHAHHLEADHHAIADAVAVAGGEVAVDAAPDRAALGAHADVLDDVEAAVGVHLDHRVVGQDALARLRLGGAEECQHHQGGGRGRGREGVRGSHACPHHYADHRDSSTLTAASHSSSAWKNPAASNVKLPPPTRTGPPCP